MQLAHCHQQIRLSARPSTSYLFLVSSCFDNLVPVQTSRVNENSPSSSPEHATHNSEPASAARTAHHVAADVSSTAVRSFPTLTSADQHIQHLFVRTITSVLRPAVRSTPPCPLCNLCPSRTRTLEAYPSPTTPNLHHISTSPTSPQTLPHP